MRAYRSNDPKKMHQYNVMMELANDPTSTLYNADGSFNRSASHRNSFWNGYVHGFKYPNLVPTPNMINYCIFRAGIDFKAQQGKVSIVET